MPIPPWITKWIQQEDDEFADVVCNDDVILHMLLDNTISPESMLQQEMLSRYVAQHVAVQHHTHMQSRDAATLDLPEHIMTHLHTRPTLDASEE